MISNPLLYYNAIEMNKIANFNIGLVIALYCDRYKVKLLKIKLTITPNRNRPKVQ